MGVPETHVRSVHRDVVTLSQPVIEIAKEQRSVIAEIRSLEAKTNKDKFETDRLATLKDHYESLRTGVVGPFNTLLGYLLDNFSGVLSEAEFNRAWRTEIPAITDPEVLSTIPDKLIPMTVVRQLSRDYKLVFPFTSVPYFRDYTARYSTFAIASKSIG